jgi:hypothetical protein
MPGWRPVLIGLSVIAVAVGGGIIALGSGTGGLANAAEAPAHSVHAVTASNEQAPNIALNAIDGNTETRWSADGVGQWISFDLGDAKPVHGIAIAWHQGDQRTATFDVEVSTNMVDWVRVQSGRSSGSTAALERYAVWHTDPRFVRIVGRGNSVNTWNSITEVRIFGADSGPAPTTPAPTTPLPTTPPPTATTPPAGGTAVKAACRNAGTVNNGTHARSGFPTDATTGPQVGGHREDSLRSSGRTGQWRITGNGTVVDGVYHNGTIVVDASNVTIRNSIVCGTGNHIIFNNSTGLTIENSILRGERGTVANPDSGEPCQSGVAYGNYVMRRTEVTGCADGVKATGSVEIYDSWFHDNYSNRFGNGAGTHNDTLQTTGARTEKLVFIRNAAYQDSCTSNRHFQLASTHQQTGPIADLRIQNNFFYGIKFVNIDRTTTVTNGTISGNTFAGTATRGPFSGPMYSGSGMTGVRVTANVYESGQPANTNFAASYTCVAG